MESEYRAVVSDGVTLKWEKQLWPGQAVQESRYNTKGIRSVGGETEDGFVIDKTLRFSKDEKYGWDEKKIQKYLKKKGYNLLSLKSVKPKDYEVWKGRENKIDFRIFSEFKIIDKLAYKEGEDLIIEGVVNSDSVDAHEEIVDPDAVMESKAFYMKFPTVRLMHDANSIGKTLDLWKDGNKVYAKVRIDGEEEKVIKKILKGTLKAFSIGFRALKVEQFCPEKDKNGNLKCYWKFVKIMLVEISLVDSPANRDAVVTSTYYKSLTANKWVEDQQFTGYKTTAIVGDGVEPPEIVGCPDGSCDIEEEEIEIEETKAEKRECECVECGHTIKTKDHCKDLKCSECGGQMRNKKRPGPGQKTIKTTKIKKKIGKSGVNIHKKVINKPFSNLDINKLNEIRSVIKMPDDDEIVQDDEVTEDPAAVADPQDVEPTTVEDPEEVSNEDKVLAALEETNKTVKSLQKELAEMKMSEEERKASAELEAKVAEQMSVKDAELAELQAKLDAVEKEKLIAEEVQKQIDKLPPTKRGLASDAKGAEVSEWDNDMPGIPVEKQAAYRRTAKILESYATPPEADDE